MAVKAENQKRSLNEIAHDIKANWPTLATAGFGAVPYLDAMNDLDRITDRYHQDSGESIVRYFLVNATAWRGEHAKRIKAELRAMLA